MRFAIIDTETTGLLNHPLVGNQPRMIEFGAVVIDGHEWVRRYSFLVNPGINITPEITRITGISNEELQKAKPFSELCSEIRNATFDCDAVFAHNLPFDKTIVDCEFSLIGQELRWPRHQICTSQESENQYGKRMKLKQLYELVVGEKWVQQHRALDDAEKLAEIILASDYYDALLDVIQ